MGKTLRLVVDEERVGGRGGQQRGPQRPRVLREVGRQRGCSGPLRRRPPPARQQHTAPARHICLISSCIALLEVSH